jgi:hypothetical protein
MNRIRENGAKYLRKMRKILEKWTKSEKTGENPRKLPAGNPRKLNESKTKKTEAKS